VDEAVPETLIGPDAAKSGEEVFPGHDAKIQEGLMEFSSLRKPAAEMNHLAHDPIVGFGLKLLEVVAQPFHDNFEKGGRCRLAPLGIFERGGHFTKELDEFFFKVAVLVIVIHKGEGNLGGQAVEFLRISNMLPQGNPSISVGNRGHGRLCSKSRMPAWYTISGVMRVMHR